MVDVALLVLDAEAVDALELAGAAQREQAHGLRLAASEECAAVRARDDADLAADLSDLVGAATVGPALLHGDAVADDVLLELGEGALHVRDAVDARVVVEQRLDGLELDGGRRVLAVLLVGDLRRGVDLAGEPGADLFEDALVDGVLGHVPLGLAAGALQLELHVDELLDLVVRDAQGLDHDRLGDLLGARLDHHDGVAGAGDHEVDVGLVLRLLERRVHDELAVDATHAHGADGAVERDLADAESGGGAQRGEHVVGVLEVDRERGRHDVDLVHETLGEQRPDGPVDLASAEDGLLARPRLALDEAAGDLAGGVVPLFDVDGERKEVLSFADVLPRDGAHEHHGVPTTNENGAVCLLGQTAGLEGDRLAPDLYFYCVHLFLRLPSDPTPHCVRVLSRPCGCGT